MKGMDDIAKHIEKLEAVASSEQMNRARRLLKETIDTAKKSLSFEDTSVLQALKGSAPNLRLGLTELKRGIIQNIAANLEFAHIVSDSVLIPDTNPSILAEQIFLQIIDEMLEEREKENEEIEQGETE